MSAINTFRQKLEFRNCTSDTIRRFTFVAKDFIEYSEKESGFNKNDVERYILHLKRRGCSGNYQRFIFNVLRMFYRALGLPWGFENYEGPKTTEPQRIFFTRDEMDRLDNAAAQKGNMVHALINVALISGARRKELCLLDRSDYENFKPKLHIKTIKRGRERIVFLDKKTERLLDTYLRTRKDKNPALFVDERGNRLNPDTLTTIFVGIRKTARIRKKTGLHGIRRGRVTMLAQEGFSSLQLAAQYGWKSDKMPALYSRLEAKDIEKEVRRKDPFYKRK